MKNSKKASPNRKKGGLQLEVKTMVDKAKIHQGFIKRQRAITKTTHDISLKTSTKKEDFFKCRDCPQVFENKLQLTRHRHYMHSKYAQRQFRSMYTSNEDSTKFTCCKCNNTFDSRKEVETHVQVHLKRYTCPECDEVFLSLKLLVEHSRKHSKENMFHCNECDHKSKYCYLILAHINVKHLKINEIKCTHCDKSFATNAQYRIHFENHHTAIEYKCVVCSKVFQGREGLLQHQRVTHFVSTSNTCCPVCGKRFTNLITLRNHMRDHNSSQLCNVCGKTFRCISLLKFHMRIHTGEKPFKCVSCDKSFRRIQYLRLHTRVHTGEEPFKCEHCGKGFKQQTPLRIHRRIHTGERPFKCIICQKGFVTGTLLKKHQNVCSSK